MKSRFIQMIAVTLVTATFMAVTSFQLGSFVSRTFALCIGTGCNGLFPDSSGCATNGIISTQSVIYPASSKVEMRHSGGCSTRWTRTTNTDSLNRSFYANATFIYNISPWYYNVPSGGKIVKNASIFSQQRFDTSNTPHEACGYVSGSAIPGPVTSPCTP